MNWQKLTPLEMSGKLGEQLNRRIKTHLDYRAMVEGRKPKGNRFYKPDEAYNEALRREVVLRRDIINAMKVLKHDHTEHTTAAKAISDELRQRGGHTSYPARN